VYQQETITDGSAVLLGSLRFGQEFGKS